MMRDVRHKLLVGFNIIFPEKPWILKVWGAKPWLLLVNEGLIRDYADLYELTTDQIIHLDRMAEKSADNLVNGVQASKDCAF